MVGGLLSAALVALLILAHNITALFTIPILILYLSLLAWRGNSWRRLLAVVVALTGGLALSAFYWLPAVAERKLAKIDLHMLSGAGQVFADLYSLGSFVQPYLIFDYWGELCFHISLWQIVLGSLAILLIGVHRSRLRYNLALLAGILALLLFLQLDLSRPFWEALPLVRYIQFPWRLLGPTAFVISLLIAAVFRLRRLDGVAGVALAAGLCTIIVYSGTARLDPKPPEQWYPITESEIGSTDLYARGSRGYNFFTDYQPTDMTANPCNWYEVDTSAVLPAAPLSVGPAVKVLTENPFDFRLTVDSAAPFRLGLPRVYLAGWQAYVDGKRVPTGPYGPSGMVSAEVPSGHNEVTVRFEDTPARQIAELVSFLTVFTFVVAAVVVRQTRLLLMGLASGLALLLVLMFSHQGLDRPSHYPVTRPANFEDTVHLLGYELAKSVWQPGETMAVRLYWFVQKAPPQNLKVFMHLVSPDDSQRVAQSDTELIGGANPAIRWQPSELIIEERQIELPADIPAGPYQLLIGLYRPETVQNLTVSQALEVLPGERVALGEIQIEHH